MTPKEKAEELIDKMYSISGMKSFSTIYALIAVEQIIEALITTTGHLTINRLLEQQELQMDFDYWNNVLTELNKMYNEKTN